MANSRPRKYQRRRFQRKKFCRFCANKELIVDYKNVATLRHFITERGKIIPRRISGTCAKHQRALTRELKKARLMALIPFTTTQTK